MIASLKGTITDIFSNFIIVEVNGVGYKVEGVGKYLEVGVAISLYIFTHYSQQDTRLFGFLSKEEYLLFQDLLIVSGVGPKTAANLINNVGVSSIKSAIINNEPKALTGNGVGLKTAQKIILELLSRIEKSGFVPSKQEVRIAEKIYNEVEQALIGLDYTKNEISEAYNKINIEQDANSETILRMMLNQLVKKS